MVAKLKLARARVARAGDRKPDQKVAKMDMIYMLDGEVLCINKRGLLFYLPGDPLGRRDAVDQPAQERVREGLALYVPAALAG